jgi:hypothetical protein
MSVILLVIPVATLILGILILWFRKPIHDKIKIHIAYITAIGVAISGLSLEAGILIWSKYFLT